MKKSIAQRSLAYTGLFEAELLLELMLRYWKHPLAEQKHFRNQLLERAAEALRSAVHGEQLIEELPAKDMNLVAAIWYVEWADVSTERDVSREPEEELAIIPARWQWLESVRRSLPSCFCDPSLLE